MEATCGSGQSSRPRPVDARRTARNDPPLERSRDRQIKSIRDNAVEDGFRSAALRYRTTELDESLTGVTGAALSSSIALAQDEEQMPQHNEQPVPQEIPDEPGVEGGILAGPDPGSLSVDLDALRSQGPLESLPYDNHRGLPPPTSPDPFFTLTLIVGKAQFLVDESLHILHSLPDTQSSVDTPLSSPLAHYTYKLFRFLKSLSFIQYTSQEEPLSAHGTRVESVKRAMNMLSKAAEADNPDALFLLGELNFVPTFTPLNALGCQSRRC